MELLKFRPLRFPTRPGTRSPLGKQSEAFGLDGRTHGWDWRVLPGRADRQHALRGNGERPLRRDRLNRNPDRRRIDVLYTVIHATTPGADTGCFPGLGFPVPFDRYF